VGKAAVGAVLGVAAGAPPSIPRSKNPPGKGERPRKVGVARERDRVDLVLKKFH
jgi:hypothetical protein